MEDNPFAPHSPAPPYAFVNRRREVNLLFSHIRAAQRGNVAVNGPVGIGKTSLLRYVADAEVAASYGVTPQQLILVYLDAQSVSPFDADRFWRRIAQRLSRLPGHGLDAALERLQRRESLDVVDIEELLDAVDEQGLALVILLDEFEWVLRVDSPAAEAVSRDFLAQTASLARRSPRVLSLVVATEEPLHEATRVIESWRGSPFATIFTSVTLRPLSPEDADALLERALGHGDVSFSTRERDLLYAYSGGHPAALQAAAFALFDGQQQGLAAEPLLERARRAATSALDAIGPAPTERTPPPDIAAPPAPEPDSAAAASTGLWIDQRSGEVWVNGSQVEALTALEYNLLRLLYGNQGRLCSKNDIIRQVWGEEFMGEIDDSRVEKLISRLRRKIEPVPGRPLHVRTVRGRGYRFVP